MAEQATKPAAASRIPTDSEAQPGHEQIAALAYSLWEAKGRVDGTAEEDWFRAEEELKSVRKS